MIDLAKDIHSLTDFKRHTNDFLRQMKETGHPLVLTINGKAALVAQDAKSYQQMLDLIERAEAVEGIRRGLASMERGEGQAVFDSRRDC